MDKRKNPKKSRSSPRTEIKFNKCAGAGEKENRFSVFEFNSGDLEVEASARKTCSKFAHKSPKKKLAVSNDVDKYTFLSCFGVTITPKNGPGKEPFKVDIKDDLLRDGATILPSPGTMFQSLSLSGKPGCSSHGTTQSCEYISINSGGRINEKKHMRKPINSIDFYEDGRIDSQASTSFRLLKKEGSVGDRSSCPGTNGNDCEAVVTVSPNYIKYEDMNYRDCSLTFTSGFIRMEGRIHGRNKLYSCEWSASDIVKIDCHLCESVEAVVLNLQFTFHHANAEETCSKKSGINELEFVIIDDPQWSKKQAEIKSLNVKYKLAWETIMSDWSIKEHFHGMAYPYDDPDSVSIREIDVERLLPRTFLNNSIIDFYTKYLSINVIRPEEQNRYHFFNTFFFRKLADTDKGFPKTCNGQEAFQRVRKWTRNLKLFEKDYIFIPINYSLHWSLIVICYPGALGKYSNGSSKRPCILHMDSLRGSHGGFENLIRRYLWEEWKEQYGIQDAGIEARFLNLPFKALKVPQQENSYDCGIFLLEYAERFLEKAPYFTKRTYFSILNEALFLPTEVSIKKRDAIRRLIYKLAEEKASKNPFNDGHFSSVVTEEDDSGIKILDKEAFEGLKCNPCIDTQTKVGQSLTDTFEQEYTSISMNDENVPARNLVSTSRYEGDKDADITTPCKLVSSLMIGQVEVHLSTQRAFSCISPMVIDEPSEKDCVIEIGSNSEKRKDKDVYSSMSNEELAECVVEDSEEEIVVVRVPKHKRPFRNPQKA